MRQVRKEPDMAPTVPAASKPAPNIGTSSQQASPNNIGANGQQAQQPVIPAQAQQPAGAAQASEPKDKAEELRALLAQGYTLEQLITEPFNFAETTVRQEWRKVVKPEGKPLDEGDSNDGLMPITGKGTEVIRPDAVLQRYAQGNAEAEAEFRAMMKIRSTALLLLELVKIMEARSEAQAKALEPVMKLMRESREEMDAAAQRARASVDEAATKAATATAAQVANYLEPRLDALEKKKPDIATVQNPMQGMMARMMETMSDRLMSIFGFGTASQGGAQAPAGFTVTKRKEA